MSVYRKVHDQFVLVVTTDASERSARMHAGVAAAAAAAAAAIRLEVLSARVDEAMALFEKEYRSGKQPTLVFFTVTQSELHDPIIQLIKGFFHIYALIKVVFLVDAGEEINFSSALPQYALMGVDYAVTPYDPETLAVLVREISRSSDLQLRQRTALSEKTTNISQIPVGNDVIQYQQFETQERYLRSILPMMNIAVIATDMRGKIELWNKKASDYFGLAARDAMGSSIAEISSKSWRALQARIASVTSKSAVPTFRFTDEILTLREESAMHVDIYYSSLSSESGQQIGALYLMQDVTLMVEVDKAKTEFVSLAAHQLRTPASTINWYAQTLLHEKVTGVLSVSQREYIEQIEESSRRMSALVNTLLDVSRMELGTFVIEPKRIDIPNFFKTLGEQFERFAREKKITLTLDIHHDIPDAISWDENVVRIMVDNLLSNAVKYTPEHGSVVVRVSRYDDEIIGAAVLISVQDTGYGIPKDQQDKIFTKLFRADNIKKEDTDGTGLGLYLVKIISDHIGGRVWFSSPTTRSLGRRAMHETRQDTDRYPGTEFHLLIPSRDMQSKKGGKRLGE